jgi:hypothetical protein
MNGAAGETILAGIDFAPAVDAAKTLAIQACNNSV